MSVHVAEKNGSRNPFKTQAGWVAIVLAIIGVVGNAIHDFSLSKNTVSDLDSGQMLCYVAAQTFHDGILVPKSWRAATCQNYAQKMGGANYSLGCVFATRVDLGKQQPVASAPNLPDQPCGWTL